MFASNIHVHVQYMSFSIVSVLAYSRDHLCAPFFILMLYIQLKISLCTEYFPVMIIHFSTLF